MKKLLVFLAVCILAFLLTACNDKTDIVSTAIVSSTDASLTTVAVNENQVLYFANSGEGLIRINSDGTGREKIINEEIYNVVIKNGWIYFSLITDDNKMYKMKTDSTDEKIKISDDRISNFIIQGEWIYFNSRDDWGLYKIKTDGTDKKRLGNKKVHEFCVRDNTVYFAEGGPDESDSPLFSIDTDGYNLKDLNVPSGYGLLTGSNQLVYSRVINDFGVLERIALNTDTMDSKIIDYPLIDYNKYEKCFLYVDSTKHDLHVADLDGVRDKVIVSEDEGIVGIMSRNQTIYYIVGNIYDGIRYSINLDGTGKTMLPSLSPDIWMLEVNVDD